MSSTLQSAVKQVAISSGQILVAKGNPSVSKVMSGKQVLAQGVAKAIVSGATGLSGQQGAVKAAGGSGGKSGGQSSHKHFNCEGSFTSSLFSLSHTQTPSYVNYCITHEHRTL